MQRQLQMRIEAQGKYLQKIIEEQQRIGSKLKATEAVDKEKASESEASADASEGLLSPRKKQKRNDDQAASKS